MGCGPPGGEHHQLDDEEPRIRLVTLNDGTPVPTRRITPDDAPALQLFHLKLSNYSVYLRHIHALPRLSDNQARYFTDLKEAERFAIVALDPEDQSEIIAVVRFEGSIGSTRAEYAALVTDAWQGRGLGSALTRDLIQVARQRGVTCLYATVLPENVRMLGLLRDLGLPERLRFEDGVAEVELDLTGAGDSEPEALARQ